MKGKPTYGELLEKIEKQEKKNKQQLVNNENLLNSIFNGISDPIYIIDANFRIVMANNAMIKFHEETEEHILGGFCYEILKDKKEVCDNCYVRNIFKTGKPEVHEHIIKSKNGVKRFVDSVVYPIFDEKGEVKQVVEIARDISEKREIESRLKQSNETLLTVLNNIDALIYVADIKTYEILFLNKYARDLFGNVVGKICYKYLHDGKNSQCDFCTNSILLNKQGEPRGTVTLDYQNNKTKRWYRVADNIINWINGEKVKIEVGIDITDYKNAEGALRESEINHRTFLQNLEGISYQTKSGSLYPLFIYGKVEEITGFKIDSFLNKTISWDQIVHPDDRHLLDDKSNKENENVTNKEKTYRIIRKDGTIRWLNDISSQIEISGIKQAITNGIIYDITDKKLAQEAINNSERKFRLIYENSAIGIINSSPKDFKFIDVNQKFCDIIGYSKEELYNMSFMDITHPDDLADDKKRIKLLMEGKISTFTKEKRYVHKKGNIIWGNITVSTILDDKGKVNYITATLEDITKRKKAEKILLKSEVRLKEVIATKDKFFSIIAHDLKNPFNALLGFTELLIDNFEEYETDKCLDIIKILNETAQNSYRLLENLLEWSRTQTGAIYFNPKKIQLYKAIDFSLQLFHKTAQNKNIKLISTIKENVFVKADIDMLNTIIRNLVSNAIKFTLPKGKVIIAAENYKTPGLPAGRSSKNKEIKISVIDNGIGIRDEAFEKLFRLDVNYSTKGTGNEHGTGLGLILCKEFVNKHKGKIWVINNKDIKDNTDFKSGCNFSFTLPEWV